MLYALKLMHGVTHKALNTGRYPPIGGFVEEFFKCKNDNNINKRVNFPYIKSFAMV